MYFKFGQFKIEKFKYDNPDSDNSNSDNLYLENSNSQLKIYISSFLSNILIVRITENCSLKTLISQI